MRSDLLLDDELDLVVVGGDIAVGDSRVQEAALILMTYPGNWKQYPMTGVGEARFMNAPLDAGLRRAVSMQLEADGLSAQDATYMPEAIEITLR